MPLPISHGLLGASIVAAIIPESVKKRYYLPILTGAFLANLADFDFLFVFALHDKTWHRGITHSIFLSILAGLLFFIYFGNKRRREALAYSSAYASHFILDFITTKIGDGVELFSPFSDERYGLRWFGLSEYPSRMPPWEIILSLLMELLIFGSLSLLIIMLQNKFKPSSKN